MYQHKLAALEAAAKAAAPSEAAEAAAEAADGERAGARPDQAVQPEAAAAAPVGGQQPQQPAIPQQQQQQQPEPAVPLLPEPTLWTLPPAAAAPPPPPPATPAPSLVVDACAPPQPPLPPGSLVEALLSWQARRGVAPPAPAAGKVLQFDPTLGPNGAFVITDAAAAADAAHAQLPPLLAPPPPQSTSGPVGQPFFAAAAPSGGASGYAESVISQLTVSDAPPRTASALHAPQLRHLGPAAAAVAAAAASPGSPTRAQLLSLADSLDALACGDGAPAQPHAAAPRWGARAGSSSILCSGGAAAAHGPEGWRHAALPAPPQASASAAVGAWPPPSPAASSLSGAAAPALFDNSVRLGWGHDGAQHYHHHHHGHHHGFVDGAGYAPDADEDGAADPCAAHGDDVARRFDGSLLDLLEEVECLEQRRDGGLGGGGGTSGAWRGPAGACSAMPAGCGRRAGRPAALAPDDDCDAVSSILNSP